MRFLLQLLIKQWETGLSIALAAREAGAPTVVVDQERGTVKRVDPAVWDWLFLAMVGMLGAWILLYATSVYGAGVSSDSMFYISTADNFAHGKGFFDFQGEALIDFPPLYPFILGVLNWSTGVTPFVWGRYLNAAVLALLILSTGLLMKRCFPGRRIWFYLGTLATVFFLPFYTLAANIATDPFYILLSVWFCLAAQAFLVKRTTGWLIVMTILALAATLLRWVGLAFIVAEFCLIWIAYRDKPAKAFWHAFLYSSLACLPVVLWIGIRNRVLYGSLGRIQVETQKVDLLQNLQVAISRIIAWSSPNPVLFCLPLAAILLLVVIIINRKEDWKRWLLRLVSQPILPVLLLSGVYFLSTLATGYTADRSLAYDSRYQAPLYFWLLVLAFVSLDELVLAHLSGRKCNAALVVIILLFGTWGIYQATQIYSFMRVSRDQGVAEYNEYNNKQMVRSGLVVFLLKNPPPADMTLYSNEPEAVYFFLRRPVEMSPADRAHYVAQPGSLATLYPKWPNQPESYLIWFKPNIKRQYYDPEQIAQLADLQKIYKRYDGEVYIARPK